MKIYSVQNGDTVQEIAKKHGVSLSALRKLNIGLSDKDQLTPGMKIKVPTESKPVRRREIIVEDQDEETVPAMIEEGPKTVEELAVPVEEKFTVNLNPNTYTFKPSNVVPPTNPHNDGIIEIPVGGGAASSIPMMEDPFPDAMKQKDDGVPGQVTQEQPVFSYTQPSGYPYGQPGGTGVFSGYPLSSYPYNSSYQQNTPAGNPYQQGNVPYTQEGQTPQFGTPQYEQSNSYGYYGYAPVWQPQRNPLGCRAEDPYYGQSQDYYGQWPEQEPTYGYGVTESAVNQLPQNFGEEQPVQNPYFYQSRNQPVNYNYYPQEESYAPNQNPSIQANYAYPGQSNPGYSTNPGYFEGTEPYIQSGAGNPYGYGEFPTYMSSQTPIIPDYSMWESYVDYHQPPFQPDFPIKPESKTGQ